MSDERSGQRPTKNERRTAARQKAQELREKQKRRDKRNRLLLQGGIGVGVIAVIAVIVLVFTSFSRPAVASPANMASDGVVVGAGLKVIPTPSLPEGAEPIATQPDEQKPNVRIFLDYLCPYCGQFEQANAEMLTGLLESDAITVEYHPLALLNNQSLGTKYSQRAANAAACVVNFAPDSFFDFNTLMFQNQPAEGTEGLDDEQIKELVSQAGAEPTSQINTCIDEQTYASWVKAASDRAIDGGIQNASITSLTGTPTILVNGAQYTGSPTDPDELRQFIVTTAADDYATSSPSPSAEPDEGGE
ncbi:DsbA family protein [Mycetocola reblochoni]|uniref:Thioredoxin-like fold domain-containing protein n=2 Tax=Mycetocola reblochoni TaxID=331618 RepID=A0A1R4JR52_9MICO|nr:thioredoxin domain-containing protein [Mycetocola reblochoni]RLP69311.1 hypothetical protein D9V30_08370 [Mycetocola reblochoni]SJN34263.1 hypothetical protein FM119_08880 [Mycetocola reblochoni REB411]